MDAVEDVGNGSYSGYVEYKGKLEYCYYSIFNNLYGQICNIICAGTETRVDKDLFVIDGFHPNTMPPDLVKITTDKLLEILEKRSAQI